MRNDQNAFRLFFALALACTAASPALRAQTPPALPSWLTPFPGATEQTRQSSLITESTYIAAAAPHDVVEHYRRLFQSAGLAFRPNPMGYGFLIRATTEACSLSINLRNQNGSTAVRVTCAARRAGAPDTAATVERADQAGRKRVQDDMSKFDKPVYPQPRTSRPMADWPPWLVHVQGARLQVVDASGAVGPTYLKATYVTRVSRADVEAFYEGLLTSNGFPVNSRSNRSVAATQRSWLQASVAADESGRRVVIRIELAPASAGTTVDLRVTTFPAAGR